MSLEHGIIYLLPNSDRKIISAGKICINDIDYLFAFPISTSVYLASNEDFIFLSEEDSNTPLMAETWNPLLIDSDIKSKLTTIDNIATYFNEKYIEFIYSKLLHTKFLHNKIFTGPPLLANASQDIRFLFRAQEKQVFSKFITINTAPAASGNKNDNLN